MTASSIQHTRKVRNYRAPLLIDQRSMVRLGLVMSLFLFLIFMSGYMLGFQKAEARLSDPVARVTLPLPEPMHAALEQIEPQIPQRIEPGESIDVDRADQAADSQTTTSKTSAITSSTSTSGTSKTSTDNTAQTGPADRPVQLAAAKPGVASQHGPLTSRLAKIQSADVAISKATDTMGVGGPATSDPGQSAESPRSALFDNATQDTARYSIQVGMYSQLDNAERKVEELTSADLSAYLDDFLNGQDETRYNVRFGYFADHRSAREALEIFEQEMAGSGYIVNLNSTKAAL